MSLTIIYKKLQELKEKEKKIQDFYDPVKVHKYQHPHIQDLRDDYQEDIQNYGFSRFAFKEEKDDSIDERDRRIQSAAPFRVLSPKANTQLVSSMKPQSASMRPTTAKKLPGETSVTFQNQIVSPKSFQAQSESIKSPTAQQFGPDATIQSQFQMTATSPKTLQSLYINSVRPATAATYQNQNNALNNRNIQSANQRGYDTINDRLMPGDEEYYHRESEQQGQDNQNQETGKKIKHWKFTKKYDTNGKQAVRNQSALKKIVMDGQNGQDEQADEEQLQQVQERVMENKLNGQKIFITREGEVLGNKEEQEANRLRKYSPSEREKLKFFDSFQSQRQFLNQGDVQFKKIYSTQPSEQNDQGGSSLKRVPTPGNENDRNSKNMAQNDSYQKGSVKFQSNQSQGGSRRKIERPQTATGFSSGTSMKNNLTKMPTAQHKKRINSSKPQFSGGNESIKLFIEDEQKLFSMKKIKTAIFDPNGPNKFFAAKDYSPLEFTEWYFPNQQKDFSFKVIVIDMKTMNFVKYDNVKVLNNKLVHTTYKEEQQDIQFERIFTLLGRQNQPTHSLISPLSFYHILIYQKLASDEDTILYEKFVFKGTIQISLEPIIQNILLVYYIRYLLCFDPSDIDFQSIFRNSLYILESKFVFIKLKSLKENQRLSLVYNFSKLKKKTLNFAFKINMTIQFIFFYLKHKFVFQIIIIYQSSIFKLLINKYFKKKEKKTIPQALYDYFSSLSSKPIYIEDSAQKTNQYYIFPQLQTQLLVDDQKVRSSFESIHSQYKDYDVIDREQSDAYIDHNQNYQLGHPFNYKQENTYERVNVQIKRPTTAHPYQITNNNYFNNAQQDSNYQAYNTQFNSIQQGSMQKQLPHLNQHLLPSSSQQQPRSEQQPLNRYSSNQQLPSHLSHASLLQSGSNTTLQKPNLQQDYSKHSSTKSGLRPKTAVSKGIRSPQSASFLGLGSGVFADQQRLHFNQNQILHMQEQLKNDGRKYEKNIKGFSTPMFIKGSQVKPTFGQDIKMYQYNQI